MTYSESLTFLGQTRLFGMKLGLDRMRRLARRLGSPQNRLRFIHIAGTNGKGSTAAFCESCLRASGYHVGLYTSPHLVSIRERIQIDRVPISEPAFAQGMEAVREAMGSGEDSEATFFEVTTALALWYFSREKVDWVVWETGLGGRFDATNIVKPEICIITNIGLDHQRYLGESLHEIAMEKAGIIKPGVPVISAVEIGEASEVIREKAKSEGCGLTLAHRDMNVEDAGLSGLKQIGRINGYEFALGLIGPHQVYNAACAVEAMGQIPQNPFKPGSALGLSHEVIAHGLKYTVWPGRFEILSETPLIVLDGAHNRAGIEKLIETWRGYLSARLGWAAAQTESRAHLVFGLVSDKDVTEIASLLRPLARRVSLVRLANERTAEPVFLAQSFSGLPCAFYNSVTDLWRNLANVDPVEPILITGSLFLVGEILAQRRDSAEEYKLNERLDTFTTLR